MRRALFSLVVVVACGGEPAAGNASQPSEDDGVADGVVDPPIRALFDRYAEALARHDLGTTTSLFAPAWVLSVPAGSQVLRNDDDQRAAVLAEDAYYDKTLGLTSARITYIAQTPLGDHHALVRTRWGLTFTRTHDRVTELPRSYLVDRTRPRSPAITAVVVESDEPAAFHAIGLF